MKVGTLGAEAEVQMEDTVNAHLVRIEIGSRQQEEVWVEDNFTSIAKTIVSEWMEMKQSIKMDTFYQPLSLDERMQIVRAMNFGMLKVPFYDINSNIFFSEHRSLLSMC